ncbi:MAG TPA: S24/S26 family peptidase [Candidatus Sulfotelmatobacter sp.]|nr:S24/S26 family peptidase [Candidatus Sulfotelmatobacter sp.]
MNISSQSALNVIGCDLAAEVLRTNGNLRLGVTGWSMFPAVWPGDTICVERAAINEICEGAVVLFSRDQRLFAHRVVKTATDPQGSYIVTRGDAMRDPDAPVFENELLGRVTGILRNGNYMDAAKSPRLFARAVSTLIQRSEIASRVVVGVHGLRTASRTQTA